MSRGFTLVETVVAVGILTSGLVALAHIAAIGVQIAGAARYRTTATLVAQQKLEQLRAEAELADTASAVEHFAESGSQVCDTDTPCPDAFVTTRWSITPVAAFAEVVMIRVVVSHAHRNQGEVQSFGIRPRRIR